MTNDAKARDRKLALVTACISIGLIVTSFSYPAQSSGVPRILSVTLLGLSLLLLWNQRSVPKPDVEDSKEPPVTVEDAQATSGNGQAIWKSRAFWMFIGTLIYAGAISILGFFTASFLYLLIATLFLGQRKPIVVTLFPIGLCALLYLLFRVVLRVAIPSGFFM